MLPWLFRLPVLTHYRGYSYPEDCGRLRAYVEAAGQRPAVAATLVHPDGKVHRCFPRPLSVVLIFNIYFRVW